MNFSESENSWLHRVANVIPFLALAVLSGVLWLPFGLYIGFYADDWMAISSVQSGQVMQTGLRPFSLFPWVIAYHLDPNTFLGSNLVLWLLILGKSIVFYLILYDLDFDKLFAFGTAVLVLLYPADTGVFYMGALQIHGTVFLFLLSAWLVIRFWKSGRRWLWLPIWIGAALCLGSYEAVFPLFLTIPVILVYKQRRITRRVVAVSFAWFLMPVIFGLRILFTFLTDTTALSYQTGLLMDDRSIAVVAFGIWRAIRYTLFDSWLSAFRQTLAPSGWRGFRNIFNTIFTNPHLVYALFAVLVLMGTLIAIRKYSPGVNISTRTYTGVALAGILFIVLAFLPYTLSNLRDENLRTLLHASQGAALTVSTCVWMVGSLLRRIKFVYATVLTVLVLVGMTSLLNQHYDYVLRGQSQIPFMQKLVQTVPQFSPSSAIVVVDDTPAHTLVSTFNHIGGYLTGVMRVVYSDPTLTGVICNSDVNQAGQSNDEVCGFDAAGMTVFYRGKPRLTMRYDQLIIFRYNTRDGLQLEHDISSYSTSEEAQQLYRPDARINATRGLPLRATTMLGLEQ